MRSLLLSLLLCSGIVGQEIPILGPTLPIQPGQYTTLNVVSLTEEQLVKTQITVTPMTGVTVNLFKTWNNQPVIFFTASIPGKYHVEATLNKWRQLVDDGLTGAKAAAVKPELLQEYEAIAKKLVAEYPIRIGTAVVEVAGQVPPPVVVPPGPGPTPPVPNFGQKIVTILWERATLTPNQSRMLNELRTTATNEYLKTKGHRLTILDDDHPLAVPLLPKLTAASVQTPAIVIQDAASSAVVYLGELPDTTTGAQVIELLKKYGG